jgi:excisionase family DNA binding protein
MTLNQVAVFTAQEAADYLKVALKTVRELAAAGKLPGRKVGKEWRFLKENLEKWLYGDKPEDTQWHCDESTDTGTSIFDITDAAYEEALDFGLARQSPKERHRNSTTK